MFKKVRKYINELIGKEISSFCKYFDKIIYWNQLQHPVENLFLFENIENTNKSIVTHLSEIDVNKQNETRVFVFNGVFNHNYDIQGVLLELKKKCDRGDRIATVIYNPYFRWLYQLVNLLGIRKGKIPKTFITFRDLDSLAKLSGFEVLKSRPSVFSPFKFLGLGILVNWLIPAIRFLKCFSLVSISVLRPIVSSVSKPSISIVIPARNEKGNIENALKRIPDLNCEIEVLFVEGHSTDDTWSEIQRVLPLYKDKYKLSAYQQSGKGKNDAVRLGFSKASHDLLTILDADLTMPPELLGRFYNAYIEGLGDFINGNRLTYPMEGDAMRFLNHLGNVFFAKALSYVLDAPLGDSLCGTKLLSRSDYQRVLKWRNDFGDFDPFGDYELLFPASVLNFGIVDIPIRYAARTYGSTNINRFRHGIMLLKMTLIGLFRIKTGR
jgi:hypothetical protein